MSAIPRSRQDSSAAINAGASKASYRTDHSEGPAGAAMTSLPTTASTPIRSFNKRLTTSHTNMYAQPRPIMLFDSKTIGTNGVVDFEDMQVSSVVEDVNAPAVSTPSIDGSLVSIGPYKTSFPQGPSPSPPSQWMADSPCASSCAYLNKSTINNNESTAKRILFSDSILEEAQSSTADFNRFESINSINPVSISPSTQSSSITIKLEDDSQRDNGIGHEDLAERPMENQRTVPQFLETLANCRSYEDTSFLTDSTLSPLPSTPLATSHAKARISQAREHITSIFDYIGKSDKTEAFFQSSTSTDFTSTFSITSKERDATCSTTNPPVDIAQRDLNPGESPCSFSDSADSMACVSIPVFKPGIDTENVLISGTGMASSMSSRDLGLTPERPSSIPEETSTLDDSPTRSLGSGSPSPQSPSLDMSVAVPTNVSTPDPPSRPSIPARPRNRTVLHTSTSGSHRVRLQPIAPDLTRHPLGDINASVWANGVPVPTVPRPTRQRHIRTSSRDKSENRISSVSGNTRVRPGTGRVNTTNQVHRHVPTLSIRMHNSLHTTTMSNRL